MSKLTPLQATAPRKIWLQISDEADHHAEPFPREAEITWCEDSVTACQVGYVREDLAQPATMSTTEALPELPEKGYLGDDASYGYDEQDMRDYARAALAAAAPSKPDLGEPGAYDSPEYLRRKWAGMLADARMLGNDRVSLDIEFVAATARALAAPSPAAEPVAWARIKDGDLLAIWTAEQFKRGQESGIEPLDAQPLYAAPGAHPAPTAQPGTICGTAATYGYAAPMLNGLTEAETSEHPPTRDCICPTCTASFAGPDGNYAPCGMGQAETASVAGLTSAETKLRMIFNAWNEFGPEHGFGELMDRLQGTRTFTDPPAVEYTPNPPLQWEGEMPAEPSAVRDQHAFKAWAERESHDNLGLPGNLWGETTVREKALMLKAWYAAQEKLNG